MPSFATRRTGTFGTNKLEARIDACHPGAGWLRGVQSKPAGIPKQGRDTHALPMHHAREIDLAWQNPFGGYLSGDVTTRTEAIPMILWHPGNPKRKNMPSHSVTGEARAGGWLDRMCEEPFRVFFPLGLLASVLGVLLWPAYYGHWFQWRGMELVFEDVSAVHARWMICGFGGCFVIGFLGTAAPRLIGAGTFSRFEMIWHVSVALAVFSALGFGGGQVAVADLLNAIWLLGVLCSLAYRLLAEGKDVPPPGFPLVILGMVLACVSSVTLALDPIITLEPGTRQLARLALFQGFVWLPILGVAPYMLPRFFGRESMHAFDESESIPRGWWQRLVPGLLAAVCVLASFVMEVRGFVRSGLVLRAVATGVYLLMAVPGLSSGLRRGGLVVALRVAVLSVVAGWFVAAWFAAPEFAKVRIGWLHLSLIAGAGLLMLTVATRVFLGHSGRHDRLAGPMRWFHVIWGLVLLAATTRASAELLPRIKQSHHIYAAGTWVVIVLLWTWWIRAERRAPVFDEASWARKPH